MAGPPAFRSDKSRRINVLQVIDGLGIGGAEMVVRDLARGIDPDRFQVAVCCTKGLGSIGESLRATGGDVFVLPRDRTAGTDYWTPLKLHRVIADRQIDIVHSHSPSALWDCTIGKVLAAGAASVHTFHFGNYPNLDRTVRVMERVGSGIADRLVAVGHHQRHQILATFGLHPDRVQTIWNSIPEPVAGDTSAFRAQVAGEDGLVVGTIAKLIPQKGLDDLLEVAKRCHDRGMPLRFVILGEGPLRADLERRRRDLGLDSSVVLTGWFDNAAGRALPAIDVFFQPSRWEAMSIAVLEAMATRRPIVATRVGDNPYVLDHGRTGLLVDAGDVAGMAEALYSLVDHGRRAELGHAARAAYEARFTLDHMLRAYERVYLGMLGA